jgi:hypothetical protein
VALQRVAHAVRVAFDGFMKTTRTRPERQADLAKYYGGLLDEQAQSGLSVRAFAAEAGVSAWTLYSWRRRLAELAEVGQAGELVEVQVSDDGGAQDTPIVVAIDGRLRIELAADFDAGALERVLGVLSRC